MTNLLLMRRRAEAALVMVLLLALVAACSDRDLKRVSDALVDTGLAVGTMQTTVISAQQNNLMTEAETRSVLQFCQKVTAAGKQASDMTRKITRLAPEDRKNIGEVLDPILKEIINARGQIAPIKNENTRLALQATLASIETAVTVVKATVDKR